jgi:hypothetical protein
MRRYSLSSDSARRALGVMGIVGLLLTFYFDANVRYRFHTRRQV